MDVCLHTHMPCKHTLPKWQLLTTLILRMPEKCTLESLPLKYIDRETIMQYGWIQWLIEEGGLIIIYSIALQLTLLYK